MKKTMLIAAVIVLAGMQIQTARAGDREWATAGKILTGIAIGAAIVGAVDAHASYSVTYSTGPAYCPPAPVVYAPAPVACVPRPVVVVPAPVVCAPRPVVVYRPAVVCAPPVRVAHYNQHGRGHRGHR